MGEYAEAGVDYSKLQPFKDRMVEIGRRSVAFPHGRQVRMPTDITLSHGATFYYTGNRTHMWCNTTEGLGNKNWIAEWMYQFAGTGKTYYDGIGIDTILMAVNDVIASGAMPVIYTDEVAAGSGDWFLDEQRSHDLAESFFRGLEMTGMALGAGETPALKYLINALPPVQSAPSLSGTATGIIAPKSNLITGKELRAGDRIIGVRSSGIHANGISLVIKRALDLPDQFLTVLPTNRTLGEEALIPTRCYIGFVEALLDAAIDVHAFLPGTGDGVAKLAFDKRPFTYRVHSWLPDYEIPPLFRFMQDLGVSLQDCLTTFNWGMGYYAFVAEQDGSRALEVAAAAGFSDVMEIGVVEEGERQVVFEPEGITLPPPGE